MKSKYELARMIDHTNLKAFATEKDFEKLCNEAKENHFAMVAINSYPVEICKKYLKDTDVHVGAAIGFPLGQLTIETKVFEAKNAIEHGADEIDYVLNVGKVKEGDFAYIQKEMEEMRKATEGALLKVIFENCYLEKEEIRKCAEIARVVKPDYIKTSTGFGTGGATVEDVRLMKETVGDTVKVKAAGGIRSLKTMLEMIDAGAERIGTSSGVKIMEEYDSLQ